MKKVNKLRMRESIVSYCFLAPALIFFAVCAGTDGYGSSHQLL